MYQYIFKEKISLFNRHVWLCFFLWQKNFVHKFRVDLYKSCFILKKTYHFTLDMFDLIFVYIYITKKVVIVNSNVWLFIRQQWRRWLLDTTRRISLTLNFRKSGAILKMRRIEKVCVNSPSYKHFNPFYQSYCPWVTFLRDSERLLPLINLFWET